MTDSDREKRIEVFHAFPARDWTYGGRSWAERAIDRLDRAVPVVSLERAQELKRERDEAVAAARDFAAMLGKAHVVMEGPAAGWREVGGELQYDDDLIPHPSCPVCRVLARHPSFLPPDREE